MRHRQASLAAQEVPAAQHMVLTFPFSTSTSRLAAAGFSADLEDMGGAKLLVPPELGPRVVAAGPCVAGSKRT